MSYVPFKLILTPFYDRLKVMQNSNVLYRKNSNIIFPEKKDAFLNAFNFQVNIDSSGRRAGSADAGIPPAYLPTNKPNLWIPDYNVKFITDGVYLKIR